MKVKYFVALTIVLPQIAVIALYALSVLFEPMRSALQLLAVFAFGAGMILLALMLRLVRDRDFMESEFQ